MKEANQKVTTLVLDNNDYKFKATGTVTTFDGYLKAYKDFEKSEDKEEDIDMRKKYFNQIMHTEG